MQKSWRAFWRCCIRWKSKTDVARVFLSEDTGHLFFSPTFSFLLWGEFLQVVFFELEGVAAVLAQEFYDVIVGVARYVAGDGMIRLEDVAATFGGVEFAEDFLADQLLIAGFPYLHIAVAADA